MVSLLTRGAAMAAVFALAVGTAAGQKIKETEPELTAAARKTRPLAQKLLSGQEQADAKNKDHLTAIDHAAKTLVYPLHWESGGRSIKAGKMWGQVDSLATYLDRMSKPKAREQTKGMQQMFCKSVIDRCVEVIGEGRPIAGVNAARMLSVIVDRKAESGFLENEKKWTEEVLPRLAEGNAEHLATTLVTLLNHKKATDGVRYYLLRALANLMALPPQETPLLKKETEQKVTREALKIVEKKMTLPKAAPREEVEGYKMLRLQAVAVLAHARAPSLSDKERPALALARVAVADPSIAPAPRLAERIEATIGLARLTARSKDADLQVDYAAEQIARGVLAFALAADKNIDSRVLDSKTSADTAPRARGWKVDAARLIEAVELLKNSKNTYVQDVVRQAVKTIRPIEDNKQGDGGVFGDWLDRNGAKAKSLFKSDDATTVKPLADEKD
jgi:hypothetical protein